MNEKVRIITDSGCDISAEAEKEWAGLLEIMSFAVTINGETKLDRVDIGADEFHKILKENQEIPKHSQITQIQFEDKFRELYGKGVRTIIVAVINSYGSQTCSQARIAADNIKDDLPDLDVRVVDSRNYSLGYGYPIVEACKKLSEGQSVDSVVSYLEDWASHIEAYLVGFDLRHMKKSGRISAAASFLGELMGLKPLIVLYDGITEVVKKARGEKAIINAAVETAAARMTPKTPYYVITTTHPDLEKEFIDKLTKKIGYPPAMVEKMGVVVSCNAGPDTVAVFVRGPERS